MKKKLLPLLAASLLLGTSLSPAISFATERTGSLETTAPSTEDSGTISTEETTESSTTESSSGTESSSETTTPSNGEETTDSSATIESQPTTPQTGNQSQGTNHVPSVDPEKEGTPVVEHTTVANLEEIVIVKNQTTDQFIESIGEQARKVAHEKDLYASVMIAQAILESGSGNSGLSVAPYYNLFGIKGSYEGSSVTMKTQEDDGKGNLYTIDSAFRQYPSYKESLEDYAKLLKEGLSGNSEFYKGTWKSETTDYTQATAFLTGKYATDVQYSEKINKLIEVYELTKYDALEEKTPEQKEQEQKQAEEKKINEQKEKIAKLNETHITFTKELQRLKQEKKRKELEQLVLAPSKFLGQLIKQLDA
ncbi:glucosaminidase domain-containing protein [Enterococcus rivorum]|uniref:Mannosyl-glycoprotein endo-beta-N-acetylglucosamidase-like domain-containing protein n=1 Tax=Enterococcus rivorum TaxID=762845 RepID=A0A1E5KUV7_9ENTE|nr:glucosaminidase domain-containing protein [Enterococcus rivorum]MBP2099084.1 flagellum-specific peptidoglycan hydrolase FlgJ [Enterococcus rivorum]OEH81663.1 hypothetical protein BCR26_15975 [Enterococcus rivorum]